LTRTDPRFDKLSPVSCVTCGASVLVVKFSAQHTSVQWSLPAMRSCVEFTEITAGGGQTALSPSCARLRACIDAAVRAGRLPVAPP
jgi:hypothetical protein